MKDESDFLPVGRHRYFRRSRSLDLRLRGPFGLVGHDTHRQLLRLGAFFQRIDFAVIAIAEQTVPRGGKETHRMLGVAGQLYLTRPVHVAPVHIKRPVFLAQVIKRLAVGASHRRAVFPGKVRQLRIGPLAVRHPAHPDVAGDRRSVVLAPRVLISLLIVIQQGGTVAPHADVFHRDGRVKHGAPAFGAHLIHLRKLAAWESHVLCVGHQGCLVQHVPVIAESHGRFVSRMSSNPLRRPSVFTYHVNIQASLAAGSESQPGSVGAPHGTGVVSRVRSKLRGSPSLCGNRINVAFVAKSDGASIGRYRAMAHPQRGFLRAGNSRQRQSRNQ